MENLCSVFNNNNNGTLQKNVQYRPATSFLEIKTEKQVQQLFCVQEKLSDDNWCNLCSPTHLLPNIWPKSSRSSCTLLKIWSMIWQENVYVKQNYCIFSVHPISSMLLHYICHILESVWSIVNRTITSTEELPATIAPIRPKCWKSCQKIVPTFVKIIGNEL